MEDLSTFIHDARKPLNGISMQAEFIKMLIETYPDNEKVVVAANKIIANAKQCSEILQQLSDYANKAQRK